MRTEEYKKKLDDHMAKIAASLKKLPEDCPQVAKIRNDFIKLGADVICTDTGLVMTAAIEVAHDLLKRIYTHTKHVHPEDGIHRMIECELKGDPFYGDILGDEKNG